MRDSGDDSGSGYETKLSLWYQRVILEGHVIERV